MAVICRVQRRLAPLVLLTSMLAASAAWAGDGASAVPAGGDSSAALDALRHDVTYLASDELKGRGLGTPELDKAADYIAQAFSKAGLKPAGSQGFFQPFEIVTEVSAGKDNRLKAVGTPGKVKLKLDRDFRPLSFSDTGAVSAGVVFAGYGISAPELSYDDFAGQDVKDKLVVVLRGLPGGESTRPFDAPGAERYGQLRYKALNAREHGARAILLVDREAGGELLPMPKGQVVSSSGVLAVHVTREAIDRLLSAAGLPSLKALSAPIDEKRAPASRALDGLQLELQASLSRKQGSARNVVGMLEGADPTLKQQVLVIGAHYDHLGLGGESSLAPEKLGAIHHGADDNASGTAAVIELARQLAAGPAPRRSILFMAFSAEEAGLGGSAFYVRSPLVPIDQTIMMINLDMVGRLKDKHLYVQGVDTAEGIRAQVEQWVAHQGLTASYTGDGYGPSDHTPFYAREIPVLFFFTGAHADYHRPSDTADKINVEGMAQVVSLVHEAALSIANTDQKTHYVRLSMAPPPEASSGTGRSSGYGAYLGTIPDFTEGNEGVVLTGVRPGSPAEQAGIQAGDTIISLGGQNVKNLQDYTYALRAHKAGDVVEIVLRRSQQNVTVKATLGRRP